MFNIADEQTAWRVLFITGALPALAVIYIRRKVKDAPVYQERREQAARGSLKAIFQRDLVRTTLFASLLSTGCQGGYYTIATWLPAFLRSDRKLSVGNTSWWIAFFIVGAFLGYLTGGYLTDRLGRKNSFRIFAVLSGLLLILYTQLPASTGSTIMYLGFPLGFCASAIFSGFGSFLAELFPIRARGAGQAFCYNSGRAVGAVFPLVIGYLADKDNLGIGGAMLFGAGAYVLAFMALFGLPETRGRDLS